MYPKKKKLNIILMAVMIFSIQISLSACDFDDDFFSFLDIEGSLPNANSNFQASLPDMRGMPIIPDIGRPSNPTGTNNINGDFEFGLNIGALEIGEISDIEGLKNFSNESDGFTPPDIPARLKNPMLSVTDLPSPIDDKNPPSPGDDKNPPSPGDDKNPSLPGDDDNPPPVTEYIDVNIGIECYELEEVNDDIYTIRSTDGVILPVTTIQVIKGSTVIDVMKTLNDLAGVNIPIEISGEGVVTSINEIENMEVNISGVTYDCIWNCYLNSTKMQESEVQNYILQAGEEIIYQFNCVSY